MNNKIFSNFMLQTIYGYRPWADHGKIVWESNCVAQICRMKYFDVDLRFELC